MTVGYSGGAPIEDPTPEHANSGGAPTLGPNLNFGCAPIPGPNLNFGCAAILGPNLIPHEPMASKSIVKAAPKTISPENFKDSCAHDPEIDPMSNKIQILIPTPILVLCGIGIPVVIHHGSI